MAVAMISWNSSRRPGKLYLAKTAPATSEVSMTESVDTIEVPTLLRKKRAKGAVLKMPTKLSQVGAWGSHCGGQMAISAAGLKEVASIHSIGSTMISAPAIKMQWTSATHRRAQTVRCGLAPTASG